MGNKICNVYLYANPANIFYRMKLLISIVFVLTIGSLIGANSPEHIVFESTGKPLYIFVAMQANPEDREKWGEWMPMGVFKVKPNQSLELTLGEPFVDKLSGEVKFTLRSPQTKGIYRASRKLKINGELVTNGLEPNLHISEGKILFPIKYGKGKVKNLVFFPTSDYAELTKRFEISKLFPLFTWDEAISLTL